MIRHSPCPVAGGRGRSSSNGSSDAAPFSGGSRRGCGCYTAFGGYATAYETASALTLTTYAPRISGGPESLELTIAVIADIHGCNPWMPEERVGDIVDLDAPEQTANTLL